MYKIIVQFKRYWDQDIEIAMEHFPEQSAEKAMVGQFIRELNQESKLEGCWQILTTLTRPMERNQDILYLWVEFDVNMNQELFKSTLQNVFDEHGMTGFYEVLGFIYYPTVIANEVV